MPPQALYCTNLVRRQLPKTVGGGVETTIIIVVAQHKVVGYKTHRALATSDESPYINTIYLYRGIDF